MIDDDIMIAETTAEYFNIFVLFKFFIFYIWDKNGCVLIKVLIPFMCDIFEDLKSSCKIFFSIWKNIAGKRF